jgi:hypothetical protein
MVARAALARRTVQRHELLFGAPPLFPGEDATAYGEFLERFSAAIKPKDVFDEMWVRDCVDLTWETLRMRRLRAALLTSAMLDELKRNLSRKNFCTNGQHVIPMPSKRWIDYSLCRV